MPYEPKQLEPERRAQVLADLELATPYELVTVRDALEAAAKTLRPVAGRLDGVGGQAAYEELNDLQLRVRQLFALADAAFYGTGDPEKNPK